MSNASEARHVLVIADQKSRRIVSLTENTYSIGRDPDRSILLYDRQVSRYHASLVSIKDSQDNDNVLGYRIIDGTLEGKKSTNGIFVNGKPCLSHELKSGDVIRFSNNSQAKYHIISSSTELDFLKDKEQDSQSAYDTMNSDMFLPEPAIASLEEIFLEHNLNATQSKTSVQSIEPNPSTLTESNPNPIVEIDSQGNITYANAAAKIKFPDLPQLQLAHPILQGVAGKAVPQEGTAVLREIQVDQSCFEQHIHYSPENKCTRIYLFEVTKYKEQEAQFISNQSKYRLFAEQATDGIVLVNAQTKLIVEVNLGYCQLLGYSREDLIERSLYQLIALDREVINEQLQSVTGEEPYLIEESFHRHRDGSLMSVTGKISRMVYQGEEIFCFVLHDIRDCKLAEEQLYYQSLHDPLTQLPNRKFINQQLQIALEHAKYHQHLLSVMFLDIDSFTQINHTLGHAMGDRLLKSFSERLKGCVQGEDFMARWGNDEFVLVLPHIKNTKAPIKIAQQIFDALNVPFVLDEHRLQVKCSIGIAIYPEDGEDLETLLKHGDTALHRTKERGRNHYQFYNPQLTAEANVLLRLESLLHQGIEKNQFYLHYQPQLRLSTGKIVAMEALLRWEHPAFGVIAPRKFLPLAEKTDLILHISKWVLKTACEQNLSWQKDGLPAIPITVNLSAREFQQPDLATVVAGVLDETGLDPQWLELEITELTLRQNLSIARKTLQDLQNLGVRIALDDFGKGFSSLGYLNEFSFRTLKVHQALIRDLRGTAQEKGLISAILSIGQGFNMRIVAEGVETQAQLDILRDLKCEEIQGYWFSHPLPAKEATELLSKSTKEV